MADLQCLICDYTVPVDAGDDEVLSLLGVTSTSSAEVLLRHMGSHELVDWVKAFKMADAYIEQLEAELEEMKTSFTQPMPAVRALPPAPAFQAPDLTPMEQARMARQAQIQAVIQAHNPDETLIPRIPDAQRPEGVVGVKY